MAMEWHIETEPRPYQRAALEWAEQHQHGICCLPTGTGKTLVGVLWLKTLFDKGLITHAVVLEPTRLLVNQTADYFRERGGVEAVPIDGTISPERRRLLWSSPLVVCTAQTACNDLPQLRAQAVLVDECHHTVGQHAFAKLIEGCPFMYTLGLSATVPEKRRKQVESALGRIRYWSWSDPQIQPFVPNWIGEVFDSELNDEESSILAAIRQLKGSRALAPGMLERYLTRDGSAALRETMAKKNKLAAAFRDSLPPIPDRLHKLGQLREVFDSHDFEKAVVFVDRVSIARRIHNAFPEFRPVMFVGKGSGDQGRALQDSRQKGARLVVSTSAGEEGIDLPSADLLVIWGNAASDIRFIQRLGRIMRKAGEGLKFANFLVTPESNDFDSFAEGLSNAAEAGALEVDKAFGWDPEVLWPKTTWWHISESLRRYPIPLPVLEEHLNVRGNLANKVVGHATKRGRVFYVYNVAQIATDIMRHYLDWDTFRYNLAPLHERMRFLNSEFQERPEPIRLARGIADLLRVSDECSSNAFRRRMMGRVSKFSVKAPSEREEKERHQRICMLSEDAPQIDSLLPEQVSHVRPFNPRPPTFVTPIVRGCRGGFNKDVLNGLSVWGACRGRRVLGQDLDDPGAFWETQISRKWHDDFLGYSVGFKSIFLDFYFFPESRDVFVATWHNMNRLMLYREVFQIAVQVCSKCGGIGAARCESISPSQLLCLSCWPSIAESSPIPRALAEFGSPLK